MAQTVLITLTVAGADTGPTFNLYSNIDGFTTPFQSGITKAALLGGYLSTVVPDGATQIEVRSVGTCTNGEILNIVTTTTTTSSTSTTSTTSTSTSTSSTSTTSTTTTEIPYLYYTGNYIDCGLGCGSGATSGVMRALALGVTIGKWYEIVGGGAFEVTGTTAGPLFDHEALEPLNEGNTCGDICGTATTTTTAITYTTIYISDAVIDETAACATTNLTNVAYINYGASPNLVYASLAPLTFLSSGTYGLSFGPSGSNASESLVVGVDGEITSITPC